MTLMFAIVLQYGVVFDAGSSHTTMYVYKWDGEPVHKTAVAGQIHHCQVEGLDSFLVHFICLTIDENLVLSFSLHLL